LTWRGGSMVMMLTAPGWLIRLGYRLGSRKPGPPLPRFGNLRRGPDAMATTRLGVEVRTRRPLTARVGQHRRHGPTISRPYSGASSPTRSFRPLERQREPPTRQLPVMRDVGSIGLRITTTWQWSRWSPAGLLPQSDSSPGAAIR
jgi:hypothetical protein